ncbi:hypothetical protein MLD38_008254 [Melastoma candidum]|uniref:Uncharacterized protein n=1 Tax=Melastoma candidum TaxID=119954 RepID=A0ACB9RTX2_9MYRT|nr:hypothetical protein MLD38_008254 [Melastoma candidum]
MMAATGTANGMGGLEQAVKRRRGREGFESWRELTCWVWWAGRWGEADMLLEDGHGKYELKRFTWTWFMPCSIQGSCKGLSSLLQLFRRYWGIVVLSHCYLAKKLGSGRAVEVGASVVMLFSLSAI